MNREILDATMIDFENRINTLKNPIEVDQFRITKLTPDLFIVRDDQLIAGTKSRVIKNFFRRLIDIGYIEFVYVSSWYGAASIALSKVLSELSDELSQKDFSCTIFIERYTREENEELPPLMRIAKKLYRNIKFIQIAREYFNQIKSMAIKYSKNKNAYFIKSGFNYPEVIDEITNIANEIEDYMGRFDEVWCAVGSGTLISGLSRSNLGKKYFGVSIFNSKLHIDSPNVTIIKYPESFDTPVEMDKEPDYPSAMFYDAKVFDYVKNRSGRILIWNVI
jgi:hypothetical protein